MKLVREHIILEKFIQDSDPIHDLGIGLEAAYNNLKVGDVLRFKKDFNWSGNHYIKYPAGTLARVYRVIDEPELEYNKRVYVEILDDESGEIKECLNNWGWNFEFFKEYFEFTNIKKNVNEKFIEDSDPIKDMGIGILNVIKRDCKIESESDCFEGSQRYFNDKKHTDESYFIFIFLKYIVKRNKITQNIINDAFKHACEYVHYDISLNKLCDLESIKDVLKKWYEFEITI